jgi:hypothetical protein
MGLLLGAVGFQLSASSRDSITVSLTLETESRGIVGQCKVGPTARSRPFLDAVLEAKGFVQRVLVGKRSSGLSEVPLGLVKHETARTPPRPVAQWGEYRVRYGGVFIVDG